MRKGLNVGGVFWKETQKVGAKKQEEEAGKEEKKCSAGFDTTVHSQGPRPWEALQNQRMCHRNVIAQDGKLGNLRIIPGLHKFA